MSSNIYGRGVRVGIVNEIAAARICLDQEELDQTDESELTALGRTSVCSTKPTTTGKLYHDAEQLLIAKAQTDMC